MFGENFEIYLSQVRKSTFKFSTVLGESFKIYLSRVLKSAFKLSTMVGESVKRKRKCLKLLLNSPWLDKILKFIYLKCLKLHLDVRAR